MSSATAQELAKEILMKQLTDLTFGDNLYPVDLHQPSKGPSISQFLRRFDSIAKALENLAHDTIPDDVKETMLKAQLRGIAASWVWSIDYPNMNFALLKTELQRQFGEKTVTSCLPSYTFG